LKTIIACHKQQQRNVRHAINRVLFIAKSPLSLIASMITEGRASAADAAAARAAPSTETGAQSASQCGASFNHRRYAEM